MNVNVEPLDAPPQSAVDCAIQLRQLATIAHRVALLRMERRLEALAKWVDGMASADAELELAGRGEEQTSRVPLEPAPAHRAALGSDVRHPPTPGHRPIQPRGAHVNENTERTAAIERALAKGPMATRDIARVVGGSKVIVKMALQRMKRAGRLVTTGVTNGQRWALPVKTTTPVVSPKPATLAEAVGRGPVCKRCECALADHDPATGKCWGKKGKCVCQEFYA